MEDTFQRLKRLIRRGTENGSIAIERMYHKMIKASGITFPNVGQVSIKPDDLEQTSGCNRRLACDGVLAPVYAGKLAKPAFNPNPAQSWVPKPAGDHKTCLASAFTQQVGLEECLLASELASSSAANGAVGKAFFADLRFITDSWACGLVPTVAETATDLEEPFVIVSERLGLVWLVVCSLGRCLLGWPLQVVSAHDSFFRPMRPLTEKRLMRIIITDPFSIRDYAHLPVTRKYLHNEAFRTMSKLKKFGKVDTVSYQLCLNSASLWISCYFLSLFIKVGYTVASSPRSIVESAAARGFQKCTALLPLCLNAKGLPNPSKTQDKLLTLIQAFQGEWGWSKADIGRAMQHTLKEFKNNSTPPGADVQGPVAPDEVMDFAMALQAMDDGATDPAATDANAVDATVEVPGVGPVNVALLQALNGPLSPPRGTDDRFLQQ